MQKEKKNKGSLYIHTQIEDSLSIHTQVCMRRIKTISRRGALLGGVEMGQRRESGSRIGIWVWFVYFGGSGV
jgi:hypothetical protein